MPPISSGFVENGFHSEEKMFPFVMKDEYMFELPSDYPKKEFENYLQTRFDE